MKKTSKMPRPGRGQLRYFHASHPLGEMITAAAVQRNGAFFDACRKRRKELHYIASQSREWLLTTLDGIAAHFHLYRA